jgi:hypothetical protein
LHLPPRGQPPPGLRRRLARPSARVRGRRLRLKSEKRPADVTRSRPARRIGSRSSGRRMFR